jgi:hypothetical protein
MPGGAERLNCGVLWGIPNGVRYPRAQPPANLHASLGRGRIRASMRRADGAAATAARTAVSLMSKGRIEIQAGT